MVRTGICLIIVQVEYQAFLNFNLLEEEDKHKDSKARNGRDNINFSTGILCLCYIVGPCIFPIQFLLKDGDFGNFVSIL